ncbi:MAG TPA: hypothetical protein VNT23_03195 [Gaiellaceae bacterium]|nr:hypothetical protein [Gaiellaceae bacterium]
MLGADTASAAAKRVLNDEIAVTAAALAADPDGPQVFYCECSDLTCVGRLELSTAAFLARRRGLAPLLAGDCLTPL